MHLLSPSLRKCLPWVVALALSIAWHEDAAQAASDRLQISVAGRQISVEIAATPESRDLGLMGRRTLQANQGMFFVFPEAHRHCMWMRDTHIPLSVAFIDDRGTIVNIEDMKPDTDDYHCAARPVRYALEMDSGWFASKGIAAGSHVSGLEKAPDGR